MRQITSTNSGILRCISIARRLALYVRLRGQRRDNGAAAFEADGGREQE